MPGSIIKRGKDTYQLHVKYGTDYKGKSKRFTKTLHGTKKEAEKALSLFYADIAKDNVKNPKKVKIEEFCNLWLKDYVEPTLKKNTHRGYLSAINTHIKPDLGKRYIESITAKDVRDWLNDLNKKDISRKTILNIFSCFESMMKTALEWEYITSNPAINVKPKAPKKKEADYLNMNEIESLLKALNKLPIDELVYKVAIYIALFSGVRLGELMGLTWSNIHDGYISIRQVKYYNPGGGYYVDTPKTAKGIRDIDIPDECSQLLKKLNHKQAVDKISVGSHWGDTDFIFINQMGEPLSNNNVTKWFTNFQKENNLKVVSFHKLRHTHVSILAYLETPAGEISRTVGHAQEGTTLNIYKHLIEKRGRETADKMSNHFLK